MLRRSLAFVTVFSSLFLLLFFTFGQPNKNLFAHNLWQATADADSEGTLSQPIMPVTVTIRQQIPFTITLVTSQVITQGEGLTETVASTVTRPPTQTTLTQTTLTQTTVITFNVDMVVAISNTGVMTTPISVRLSSRQLPTDDFPVDTSLALARNLLAQIGVELIPVPEATPEITPTATATASPTATEEVSATVTTTTTVPTTVTVPTTATGASEFNATLITIANLRSDTNLDATSVITTLAQGTQISVVAQSADQNWLLLDSGYWVSVLVVDTVPAGLSTATDAQIAALRQAAVPLPPTATPAAAITPTVAITSTVAATPTPTGPISPTSTVNANLRIGPSIDFELIGGTQTGQILIILGRNADSTWYRLDNTGWISANLVANPPADEDVPVLNDDGTPANGDAPLLLPTPTPGDVALAATATATAAPTATATPARLSVAENVFASDVETAINNYDDTMNSINTLIDRASVDSTLLANDDWQLEIQTAIALLRRSGENVRDLTTPARFATVSADLTSAASSFDAAAGFFETGVNDQSTAQFELGLAEVTKGEASLADAGRKLAELRP